MLVKEMHLSNEASGDSIIFDGMVLEVRGVSSETVSLFSPCEIAARQIERSKLNGCRFFIDLPGIENRYRRLIKTMVQSCLLTTGEATNALYGLRVRGLHDQGSEAVAHVGGSAAAVRQALRCRHYVRISKR
jgi:hypothetical protein